MPRYAAIDIGSNSIRMAAAEVLPGSGMRVLASERVVTRLGESVFRQGILAQEPVDLTCTVLARMAQQYQKLDVVGVRAVATSAVRDARNSAEFVERASNAIGTPVEIVSGREESRLIHLGVEARWPHPDRRLLIVDIGGGSAELIAGEYGKLRDSFSKPLGAVRLREIFLRNDPPNPSELHQMHEYIEEKLAGIGKRFAATVVGDDPVSKGSVHLCKDYVAWAPIDAELLTSLLTSRGRVSNSKTLDDEALKALGFKTHADLAQAIIKGETTDTLSSIGGLKPFFGLSPPRGGFKRSSRRAFSGSIWADLRAGT